MRCIYSDIEKLREWAESNDLKAINEVVITLFNLDSVDVGISSLVKVTEQFVNEEGRYLSGLWQDCAESNKLFDYFKHFSHSSLYSDHSSLLTLYHTVASVKKIEYYKDRSYLIAMLLNNLSYSNEFYLDRNSLRIWVAIHSLIRIVRNHYHGDKRIGVISRFLILDHGDIKQWGLVDSILNYINKNQSKLSFEKFNYELIKAANAVLQDRGEKLNKSETSFLNSLLQVGGYSLNPNDNSELINKKSLLVQKQIIGSSLFYDSNKFKKLDVETGFNHEARFTLIPTLSSSVVISFNNIEEISEEALDEKEPEVLVEVNPEQNNAEQLVATRSVFLHTLEEASYLPWSINQILPQEIPRLLNWLKGSLSSEMFTNSLGATFCILALQTGRSLFGVRHFRVTDELGFEWAITKDFNYIHRKVVRRHDHWQPNEEAFNRINAFADTLTIKLNMAEAKLLKKGAENLSFEAESLHDIWRLNEPNVAPEVWLNKVLPDDLQRITSSKLASYLGQQVFENTSDHNLARNITAHPNSGLPAACGYGTWDIDAIEQGLEKLLEVDDSVSSTTHLLGSLLSPLEELLIDKVEQANALLDRNDLELVEFHNQVAQYTITALYAATGARYLIDPFQSLEHFNLEQGFVFINDKSDGGIHQGRIVPLPQLAIQIFQQYIKHLAMLAAQFKNQHSDLAASISQLIKDSKKPLPLFFLLDRQLHWHSMNKSDLLGVPLFEWGLPKNLFRHRYNQQLYNENVPVEVIDGLMGHAERGVITYSDTSPRCWLDDVETYSTNFERVFTALPFKVFKLNSKVSIAPQSTSALEVRLFGQALRKKKRSDTLRKNIRQTKDDIQSSLRGRALSGLSVEEIQELINKMLFRGGQLGHPFAATRLEILRKQIHREAPVHKSVIRQRFFNNNVASSTLSQAVAEDYQTYKQLKEWSRLLPVGHSHYSISAAVLIGTALLAIEKRIAYPKLLLDILEGQNFRVLKDKRQLFIEYNEKLEADDPYAPVQRHEINQKIASLIVYGARRKNKTQSSSIKEISELKAILKLSNSVSNVEVIQEIAKLVEQVNHIDMPGMLGAMLAGRVLSSSLPILDHARVKTNTALVWPSKNTTTSLSFQEKLKSSLKGQVETKNTQELKANAKAFRQAILQELNKYTPSQAKAKAKHIVRVTSEFEGKVSNALLLLGFWIAHITERGRQDRKSKPLAVSSLKTYWGTLITVFEKLAYQCDLIALDSDEVTELYRDMLDYKILSSSPLDYFGRRLVEFHRWATEFGVLAPDWSELDFAEEGRSVRPGILAEKDYHASLAYIKSAYSDRDIKLLMSFLLVLTYRFGLRSREASGLLSKDWCEYQGLNWVLVRNNTHRKLKTESSQRAVPLVFELSNLEKEVISQVLTRYTSLAGNDNKHPLFCEIKDGKIKAHTQIPLFATAIIKVIRLVTGSKDLVLHHARHAFHNRIAAALFEIDTPLTQSLNKGLDKNQVQQIVLGRNHQVSRRSSMALARLMGHSAPTTGMSNYNHLLAEWADHLTPVSSRRIEIAPCIDTKSFLKYKAPKPVKTKLEYQPMTLEVVFQALRLVAIGWSFDKVCLQLALNPTAVAKLESVFWETNNKMRFNSREGRGKVLGRDNPNVLLRYITADAWQRILSIASKAPGNITKHLAELPSLDELPNMVGRNGQVLINSQDKVNLINLVLELFSVNESHYSVSARENELAMKQFLEAQGFNVVPVEKASSKKTPIQVDQFDVYEQGKRISTCHKYGILNIFRNKEALRCSNDLVVALLGLGYFSVISRSEQD